MSAPLDPGRRAAPRARASLLARARRWLRYAVSPASRKVELPVQGLPAGVGDINAGGLALLLCAGADARARLLVSLLETLPDGQSITWLAAGEDPAPFLGEELRAGLDTGRLRVLAWSDDAVRQVRELGASHLLRELATSGMRGNDLLVVDAFEPWLAQTPENSPAEADIAEAMQCLRRWNDEHRGPMLALAPWQRRGQPLLPLVARCQIPRLATLELDGASARLDVLRWGLAQRPGARQMGRRYELQLRDAGRWECRAQSEFALAPLAAAADADRVHLLQGAAYDASSLPSSWRSYESLEALLAATRQAVAATVVLSYEDAEDLPVLARVVNRLRQDHPHLLRILVRETQASLRRHGELTLRRVGANAILHRSFGFAQLEQMVEDVREEWFAGRPVADPMRLLQHLAPDPIQGYLPPLAFCAAVERMIERTADTPLEHCLVHLPLLPNLTPADALLACSPRRDGDVVSTDEHGLYLFLFGCPSDDAVAALDAIFAFPCSELARHVQLDPDRHSQALTLADLRRSHSRSPTDFSELLQDAERAGRGTAVHPAVLPVRGAQAGRVVQAHILPLRAAPA